MAKSPKKRTKKGSQESFKRREIDIIVNHAYQRLKFLGDAWYAPRACGIQKLWTNLRGPYHDAGLSCFLNHLKREMTWSLNVSCFFTDNEDPEKLHVIQAFAGFSPIELTDVSIHLSRVIVATINQCLKVDEQYNHNNMVYYAYVLYPESTGDHDIIGDGLSDLMANLVDISKFKPFENAMPGIPSNENTLLDSLKNNGLWPNFKERSFWVEDEYIISDTDEFIAPKSLPDETL